MGVLTQVLTTSKEIIGRKRNKENQLRALVEEASLSDGEKSSIEQPATNTTMSSKKQSLLSNILGEDLVELEKPQEKQRDPIFAQQEDLNKDACASFGE